MAASITDRAWPTFIAPPLSSPSTVNSWLAAFSSISAWTSSLDLPVNRLPKPRAARPAKPTGMLASFALRAARPRLMSATCPSSMTLSAPCRDAGHRLSLARRRPEPRTPRVVGDNAMAAKQTQHDAADALYRAIIETLDKNRKDGTLTAQVLEQLARACASVSMNVPDQGRLG